MHLSKFRIRNYKSYLDSGEVTLEKGINIITGQNNVGKTAMLQALSLTFTQNQHKSLATKPTSLTPIHDPSLVEFEIYFSKEEFISFIYDFFPELKFKIPDGNNADMFSGGRFFNEFIRNENILYFASQGSKGVVSAYLKSVGFVSGSQKAVYRVNKVNQTLQCTSSYNGGGEDSSFITMASHFIQQIYFFHAQRYNISDYPFGKNTVLTPTASNLPEVLGILQSEKRRFNKYLSYLKLIFPQIIDVLIRPHPSQQNHLEILLQNEALDFERSDLLIPLSESGTGIGQVLAILYVVLTSDVPKTIIIDEPNSFLHLGAARKLIEILREHPQHQFIISTHSPSTIAAANPSTINIIKAENAKSKIEPIDVNETNQHQLYLAEIGVKLSDVFGADNILWVEGKTEEICFPKIIEAAEGVSLMGSSILGVKNTGDFQRKDSELVFQIYERLSKGKGLMPAAVGFIFDREELTDENIKSLKKRSNDLVKFIPRMMYENYLLNPVGIFNILNSIEEISDLKLSQEKINEWIDKNKWNKKYINSTDAKTSDIDIWKKKVNAVKFLEDLFSQLTETRLSFNKITHSVSLTYWIIEHSIEDFIELQELLKSILNK